MTPDFFKFPHTPQLAWLAPGQPREDKVLSEAERDAFLSGEIVVEEKVDGANVGFSVVTDGRLRAQNRGAYIGPPGVHPQFGPLWGWIANHEAMLVEALGPNLMLFGEWCFAVHSVRYDLLPDWFLGFDVYDRSVNRFWSVERRDSLLGELGISAVPAVTRGRLDLEALCELLRGTGSQVGTGPAEGFYLRRQKGEWLIDRAKLVRSEFVQGIDEHWSRRPLAKNRLASTSASAAKERAC
jgi:hypothetical protein